MFQPIDLDNTNDSVNVNVGEARNDSEFDFDRADSRQPGQREPPPPQPDQQEPPQPLEEDLAFIMHNVPEMKTDYVENVTNKNCLSVIRSICVT